MANTILEPKKLNENPNDIVYLNVSEVKLILRIDNDCLYFIIMVEDSLNI